jgi:hypothetical protein
MVVSATLLLLASSGALAQTLGTCVAARTDAPVVLPDGSRHPAGSLELCTASHYTPGAVLHEARVNGDNVGLFRSRTHVAERPARDMTNPVFLFGRADDGDLVLRGFATTDKWHVRAFRFDPLGAS